MYIIFGRLCGRIYMFILSTKSNTACLLHSLKELEIKKIKTDSIRLYKLVSISLDQILVFYFFTLSKPINQFS